MTIRDDDLGRTLRALLLEEADAMQIDVHHPAQRLQREMAQLDRKRRLGVTAAAVLAAAVAVVVGFASLTDPDPKAVTPLGPTGSVDPSVEWFLVDVDTGEQRLAHGWLSNPTGSFGTYDFSPDGSRVVWCDCPQTIYGTDADRLMLANADGSDPVEVPAPAGLNAYVYDWSPDGTKLLVRFRNANTSDLGNLFVHDLATGHNTRLTNVQHESGSQATSAEFSADGQTVLYDQIRRSSSDAAGTGEFDVWSIPVTGGEPTLVVQNAVHAHYLADGETIAYVQPVSNSYDGHQIRLFTPEGEKQTIVTTDEPLWALWISPDRTRLAYYDRGATYVIPATGGTAAKVSDDYGAWLDDRTILVNREAPQ